MVIKVGINGFGRIGRIMFRTCVQNPNIEVTAINDPAIDVEYICYLIKFDSTHGNFKGDIMPLNDDIKINGNLIKIFREKLPSAVQWHLADVHYVIESSGMFTSYEKAVGHLSAEGVRRVVVTAPSADVPMLIMGVNNDDLRPDQKVISSASSTLYCLAAIIKVLENDFGVTEGFVTSIHAMTPSLKPLDGLCLRGKKTLHKYGKIPTYLYVLCECIVNTHKLSSYEHWRDYRSIHQNIIPATTGACKALGKVLPQMKDKLVGLAFRVPIVNVSVLDLTVRLTKDTSLQKIVESLEKASKTYLKGVLNISNEEAVSSDFMRDTHSCIFDVKSSIQHKPNFYKLICWYENEFSYACRVVDTILLSEKQLNRAQTIQMINKNLMVKRKHTNQHSPERLRHFMTLTSDCNTNVLPDVLRNVSKAFEFKISSVSPYLPFRRKVPAKVSVMNQTPSPLEAKSDIFKIVSYDPVPPSQCLDKNNRDSCMTLKLINNNGTEKRVPNDRIIRAQEDVNKMMKATRELLKKSNARHIDKNKEKGLNKADTKVKDDALDIVKKDDKGNVKENVVKEDAVQNEKVKNDAVQNEKVKLDAVKNEKVKQDAVQNEKVKQDAVQNEKVKQDAVQNEKVKEDAVRNEKVKQDAVQNEKVKEDAVQNEKVKEDATKNMKLEEGAGENAKTKAIIQNKKFEECIMQAEARIDKSTSTTAVVTSSANIKQIKHVTPKFAKNHHESDSDNDTTDSSEIDICDEISDNDDDDDDDDNTIAAPHGLEVVEGEPDSSNGDDSSKCTSEEDDEDGRVILKRLLAQKPYAIDPEETVTDTSIEISDGEVDSKDDCIEQNTNKGTAKVGNISNCMGYIDIAKQLKNNSSEYTTKYVIAGKVEEGKKEKSKSKIFRHDYQPIVDKQSRSLKKLLTGESLNLELCQDKQNVSIRANVNNMEPDIFDKLDSASATNSENSFDVNEKKSQVIRINDLTDSLEDLGRLEKICKIIEISDDLSDVLFAKLKMNDSKEVKTKKWSFKDLCEKINLDDFCNKVFHESNI